MVCAPGRIRTCGLPFRRGLLYPLSYGGVRVSVGHCLPACFPWIPAVPHVCPTFGMFSLVVALFHPH